MECILSDVEDSVGYLYYISKKFDHLLEFRYAFTVFPAMFTKYDAKGTI